MKRRLLLLIALCCIFLMAAGTREDITGTGAAVQIASSGGALWVQVVADPGNSSAVRFAVDGSVSPTRGVRMAPGSGFTTPSNGKKYSLANCWVWVANGDKVSVAWGE